MTKRFSLTINRDDEAVTVLWELSVPVDIHIPWNPSHPVRDVDLETALRLIDEDRKIKTDTACADKQKTTAGRSFFGSARRSLLCCLLLICDAVIQIDEPGFFSLRNMFQKA